MREAWDAAAVGAAAVGTAWGPGTLHMLPKGNSGHQCCGPRVARGEVVRCGRFRLIVPEQRGAVQPVCRYVGGTLEEKVPELQQRASK